MRQSIGRGELGLRHILNVVLGTVERHDLDITSSTYASSQYKVWRLITSVNREAGLLLFLQEKGAHAALQIAALWFLYLELLESNMFRRNSWNP